LLRQHLVDEAGVAKAIALYSTLQG